MSAGADFGKAAGMEKFFIGIDKDAYKNSGADNSRQAERFAFERRLPHIRTAVRMVGGTMEEPEDRDAVAVFIYVPKKEDVAKILNSVPGIKIHTEEELDKQERLYRAMFREAFATEDTDTEARLDRVSTRVMRAASGRGV